MRGTAVAKTDKPNGLKKEQNKLQFSPRVDIRETEDALILYADMPGVKHDQVEVHYENGELIVTGKVIPRPSEPVYLFCEFGVGDFRRQFTIQQNLDVNKMTAELKHGVLTVTLPKAEALKPKRIPVKGP